MKRAQEPKAPEVFGLLGWQDSVDEDHDGDKQRVDRGDLSSVQRRPRLPGSTSSPRPFPELSSLSRVLTLANAPIKISEKMRFGVKTATFDTTREGSEKQSHSPLCHCGAKAPRCTRTQTSAPRLELSTQGYHDRATTTGPVDSRAIAVCSMSRGLHDETQHPSSSARLSAWGISLVIVQETQPYMTSGVTVPLTRRSQL